MKIAIVCGAPSTEMLAPFDDTSWEIWCLGNRLNKYLDAHKRITRAFEIHDNLAEHNDPIRYAAWLTSHNIPLIVGEKFPLTDNAHVSVFDYKKSEDLYGSLYLTSSPAYMMSQAISEGATEIGIYGVDLNVMDHEYFWQRPCMEAWIGFARGKGIKVTIPAKSSVGKSKYAEGRHWDGKRNEEGAFTEQSLLDVAVIHQKAMGAIQAQIKQLTMDYSAHNGSKETYELLAKVARSMDGQMDNTSPLKDLISIA